MTVNDYLKKNNITKYRLAKMCNLPYGTLNDICIGKTDITKCSGETLLKIANALNISVDDLLGKKTFVPSIGLRRISEKIIPVAEKYKLKSVYIFGSYARNEEKENSDVDILIDREGSDVRGMFAMSALYNDLKESIGKDIDLVTLQSLNQASTLKNNSDFIINVIRERIKIYG